MAFKKTEKKADTFEYKVLEDYGVISVKGSWALKLRYVQWGDRSPKYDLRTWKTNDDGSEECGKGMTFTGEEMEELQKLLNQIAE